jgi:hypothetical protein
LILSVSGQVASEKLAAMASAPPADVEPLRAKAHGVVGFAVRPATLYLDSRLLRCL